MAAREELGAMLIAVANEDREAFAALYRKTSARIFGVIVRMVSDRAEAEDLLQDVYINVWRRASAFDATRGTAMTWLITLARNRVIDRLRQSREASLDEDHALSIPDDTPSPLRMAEAARLGVDWSTACNFSRHNNAMPCARHFSAGWHTASLRNVLQSRWAP